MNAKHNFCFYIFVFLFLLSCSQAAMAITINELADTCEKMESAIVDISIEYEWYIIPPETIEEAEAEMGAEMLIYKDGLQRCKLSATRSLSRRDPNDPNFMLFDRVLLEYSATLVTRNGNSFESVLKYSYNGKVVKHLNVGGWPRESRSGIVSNRPDLVPTLMLSPLGFSVLRFSMDSAITDKIPISTYLRDYNELVRLDNAIKKVNGFNIIRADFLQEWTKQVCIRVYFSVDHGYTPVRYEYVNRGTPDLTFEVHSLEQVAEGLWFPSSGLISGSGRFSSSGEERADGFQTISKILVNQGLTDEHFNIKFPPGTEVWDRTRNLKYVVKPTEEQFK